jgi:D-alanyl-D-alanine carboxypeptidase (penicillin-binding protein 5/6)
VRHPRPASLAAILFAGLCCVAPAAPAAPAAPVAARGVSAPAAILVQRDVHRTLFARNSHQRRPIASTTKLMTAWVAVHHAQSSEVLTVQPYAATPGESLSGVAAGERLTLADLLRGMLLPSGNDIANTLAVDLGGGSQARFIGWMNDAARQLGMRDSHFSTPIGLDDPGNYSTAADLARLADAVLGQPLLASVVALRGARLADGRTEVNRNDILFGRPWVIGLKTGNTAAAGQCLVGAGRRNGTTVISVVLGEPSVAARDADSLALLGSGLAAFRAERPVRGGVAYARVPVAGRPGERVRLFAARSLTLFVPSGSTARTTLRLRHVPATASGPLPAGSALGEIDVIHGGRTVARTALVTRAPLAAPPSNPGPSGPTGPTGVTS